MAARKDSRIKTKHRDAIQTSMIIKRLSNHVDGKVEMTSTQVAAALGLLKKAIPDLKSVEMDIDADVTIRPDITPEEADLINKELDEEY